MKKILFLMVVILMVTTFKTTNISTPDTYNYSVDHFNGVDYTNSPNAVDESRAIDMSNYLPNGNALEKRTGYEFVNALDFVNVWKFGDKFLFYREEVTDAYNSSTQKMEYTLYGYFEIRDIKKKYDDSDIIKPYTTKDTSGSTTHPKTAISTSTNSRTLKSENGGYAHAFEKDGRMFVFAMNKYWMIYYKNSKYWQCEVKSEAYIPTVFIGVNNNNAKISSYEDFNMLSNQFKIQFSIDLSTLTLVDGDYKYFKSYDDYAVDLSSSIQNCTLVDIKDIGGTTLSKTTTTEPDVEGFPLYKFFYKDKNGDTKLLYVGASIRNGTFKVRIASLYSNNYGYLSIDAMKDIQFNLEATFVFDNSEAIDTINNMKFSCFYGADSYRDTLFVCGNKNQKNVDYHTLNPYDTTLEDWVTYTYIGSNTFHAIGSSSTAIIGYGLNNDSSLVIFKESMANEPNVFFRTCEWKTESKSTTLAYNIEFQWVETTMLDRVFPSPMMLSVDTNGQFIQYDNKLFVNCKDGIYYINVNNSSAESSYDGVEVSYLIRDNLGTRIDNSCYAIQNGRLYILREDRDGNKRVYVCDKNRYTYVNDKLVYEWWVLDHINADKFYTLDGELYFTNNTGLYKSNDSYEDEDVYIAEYSKVNNSYKNNEIFADTTDENLFQLSTTSNIVQNNIDGYNTKDNIKNLIGAYFNARLQVSITGDCLWMDTEDLGITGNGGSKVYEISFRLRNKYRDSVFEVLNNISQFWLRMQNSDYHLCIIYSKEFRTEELNPYETVIFVKTYFARKYIYKDRTKYGDFCFNVLENGNLKPVIDNVYFKQILNSSGDARLISINDVEITRGSNGLKYIYFDKKYSYSEFDFDTTYFNYISLSLLNLDIKIAEYYDGWTSDAYFTKIVNKKPVKSYWLSKYNTLGIVSALKTITNFYFIPDARKGGYTRISYNTSKREYDGYMSYALVKNLDFNDIEFSQFTFGNEFGRTYSAKKKIKNFSFIQLKFSSDDAENSTVSSCTFKYRVTKNNKGVK